MSGQIPPNQRPQVGMHWFDDRGNMLYDLVRGVTIHLSICQTISEDPPETREYSIAELFAGVTQKLTAMTSEPSESNAEEAQCAAEQNEDLVLVSFYTFIAAPGIGGMISGFHNAWLQGYFVAKLLKNRNIVTTAVRGTMTDEQRQTAEDKIREQGLEPYDPRRHGPQEGS